jgi:hypothetical protein
LLSPANLLFLRAFATLRQRLPVNRHAPIVDADGARLLTVGEPHQKVRQLGVGAVLGDEPFDVVAPASPARLADNGEGRGANVG